MKWAGYVACMVKKRGVYWILEGRPEGRSNLGDPDIDEMIILRWIFRK